ncbi:MAG TPA: cbb3-type cytochrome c oxidase subunit I, partial [Methylomirabilota bacterium]|nr:cbb3-type cytochrome c oxidase subunit I [Methylomirabilota bacterium]
TLRFVVVSLVFLGLGGIEGVMMRGRVDNIDVPLLGMAPQHFYAILTAHPFVLIYGFAYMAVMGAFYFLVPYVLGRDIYSKKTANASFFLIILGVLAVWTTSFVTHYAPLYTLYWPLPVAVNTAGWNVVSILPFGVGMILIFGAVLAFFFNMFATIFLPARPDSSSRPKPAFVAGELLVTAFSLDGLRAKISGLPNYVSKVFAYPVFAVGVFRGCVDTTINAIIMGGVGVLLSIYGFSYLIPSMALSPSLVDPLVYKNIFWWGLDMIADGNVLMFTAATWYLLIPLLLNRKLFGENVVRSVILADLLVSMGVWGHHMMADTPQPTGLLVEGQVVTWGELVTMGLTIFAVLMTLWLARPVKYSAPLKYVLVSIMGYGIGGSAGIIQANYAVNRYFHNTQWVVGIHAHVQLLLGLGCTIFAAIYALFPLLTGKQLNDRLADLQLILWTVGGLVMGISMGLAGVNGMLRRMLYLNGLGSFQPFMNAALLGAIILACGYAVFLLNIVRTVGLRTLIGIFYVPQAQPTSVSHAEHAN